MAVGPLISQNAYFVSTTILLIEEEKDVDVLILGHHWSLFLPGNHICRRPNYITTNQIPPNLSR
jgi:hypothetical protein